MNTPHRHLRCARCGAAPLWVITAAPDGALEPVCARCAAGIGPEPPPQPNALPLPLPRVAAARARGASIPTPLALAAVFVASFLPQAAVLASDTRTRAARALRAAIVAFEDDAHAPAMIARSSSRLAGRPTPQPMFALVAAPPLGALVATPVSPSRAAPGFDRSLVDRPANAGIAASVGSAVDQPRGLWVTRPLLAALSTPSTLRVGDFITHVNGVPVLATYPVRTCTGGDRYVRFSVVRGGVLAQRYAPCAPRAARVDVAQPRREVARPAGALLVAHR